MSKSDRQILNAFIVNRFRGLKTMYLQAEEDSRRERLEQLNNDWIEWESLDSNSREYVLDYLSKKLSVKED